LTGMRGLTFGLQCLDVFLDEETRAIG
jgi:hypothetical protein